MSALGIYFGSKVISVVETKGKKILNNLVIPHSAIASEGLEEKVPEEVKVVALFKDEFRKAKIEAQEATISLSDKDIIVRTFEMPLLPREELQNAVNFEVKKYIPFKVEDIISDFQVIQDRANRRNIILFMGIKKDALDKELSILNQLGLEAVNIDYSAFSILRFLSLAGMGGHGVTAIASVDFLEGEVNFSVLENGFPLFSRDITLSSGFEAAPTPEAGSQADLLDKLKSELRVSVDYYKRKFPAKDPKELFFVCAPEHRAELEGFGQEMGLSVKFVDVPKYIGNNFAFSLSLIKGYGASLSRAVRSSVKINLVTAKTKPKAVKEAPIFAEAAPSLLSGLKADPRVIAAGVVICALVFGFGIYRSLPVRQELGQIIRQRPQAAGINPNASREELEKMNADFQAKVNDLDNLITRQLFITEPLDVLPRVVPEGIWLDSFAFDKASSGGTLILEGMSYLGDSSQELKLVNSFVTSLKQNKIFSKYFRDINVVSMDRKAIKEINATHFVISCKR